MQSRIGRAFPRVVIGLVVVGGAWACERSGHAPPPVETRAGALGSCAARTAVSSPPASSMHGLTYDANRQVVLLVTSGAGGGGGANVPPSVLYELDVEDGAWSRVEATGARPTARSAPGFAYDYKTGRSILFGGNGQASGVGTATGESLLQPRSVWEWDGCEWTNRTPASAPMDPWPASPGNWPSSRWAPAMTYDWASERVILVTGIQNPTFQWETDPADATVFEWDSGAGTFVSRPPLGSPPTDRGGSLAIGDRNRKLVYLVTGLQENENPGGGWDTSLYVWDGATGMWSRRQPNPAPSAREFAGIYHDLVTDRIVVTGGVWYGWLWTPDYWQYNPDTNNFALVGQDPTQEPAIYNRFWSPLAYDDVNRVAVQFSGHLADSAYYGPTGPRPAPADTRLFASGGQLVPTPPPPGPDGGADAGAADAGATDATTPPDPDVNLALNPSCVGFPSPEESDHGWGGGSNKCDIVDGLHSYNTWARGLAFTGGHATGAGGPPYLEPAGPRHAVIDFGAPKTFQRVVIWWHGTEYTPDTGTLEYWNGSSWATIAGVQRRYGTMHEEGTNSGYADSDIYTFAPVTGFKVRYTFDNSGHNIVGTWNIHGWIYEMEVWTGPGPGGSVDAGPAPDADAPQDSLSPIGAPCATEVSCQSRYCVDGVCCDKACGGDDATDCQACAVATGAASNGTCTSLSPSHVCRASAGSCDPAETCDGTSAACPANQLAPAGHVCRPLAGACDVAETCSGGTAACPPDTFAAIGTVCHAGTAPCESTEVCSGDAVCPTAAPPPPSCNFMVKYTGARLLMANASGTITPGKRRDDTRTTSAPSTVQITETSPFNNSHNADAFSVVDQGATMTVSTRLAGVAALGRLSGTVQSESSTDILSSVDPSATFGRGLETMEWSDEVTVTSPTLPAGTAVQFMAQLDLDSQLGNVGGEVVTAQPAEPAYATATAVVGGTTVLTLTDRVTQPLVTRSATALVNARVGDKLVLNGRLQVYAMARLKLQTPVRVTADAGHTAIVRLVPVTSGASYVTASGRGPYVPDATPPVVTIDSPAAGAVVNRVVPVVISARDNASGVARIEAWAGTVRLGECRAASCTLNLDTRTFPDGPLLLRASAWDFEGNASAESRRQLVVDNTPPVFSNVPQSPVIAFATSTAGAKVNYAKPTAADARDGTVAVSCLRAPGEPFPVNTTPVTCTAADKRGNTSRATFTVWVQYQAPADGTFFLKPIRPNGSSIFQIGRPVPVRFKLTGASAGITNLVARLLVTKVSNSVEGTAEDTSDETVDDTDFIFKYRSPLALYAYRWRTRGETQGTFQLRAELGDGVAHQIKVSLKAPR